MKTKHKDSIIALFFFFLFSIFTAKWLQATDRFKATIKPGFRLLFLLMMHDPNLDKHCHQRRRKFDNYCNKTPKHPIRFLTAQNQIYRRKQCFLIHVHVHIRCPQMGAHLIMVLGLVSQKNYFWIFEFDPHEVWPYAKYKLCLEFLASHVIQLLVSSLRLLIMSSILTGYPVLLVRNRTKQSLVNYH